MRQGGAADPDHADDVDVQDAVPLVVRVVLDRAGGADAGVVDQHVDAAEQLGRRADPGPYGRVVGDVRDDPVQRLGQPVHVEVKAGHRRAAGGEEGGRGQPDAGRAAGDDRGQPVELTHRASTDTSDVRAGLRSRYGAYAIAVALWEGQPSDDPVDPAREDLGRAAGPVPGAGVEPARLAAAAFKAAVSAVPPPGPVARCLRASAECHRNRSAARARWPRRRGRVSARLS